MLAVGFIATQLGLLYASAVPFFLRALIGGNE